MAGTRKSITLNAPSQDQFWVLFQSAVGAIPKGAGSNMIFTTFLDVLSFYVTLKAGLRDGMQLTKNGSGQARDVNRLSNMSIKEVNAGDWEVSWDE